jgi:hypothetical protein
MNALYRLRAFCFAAAVDPEDEVTTEGTKCESILRRKVKGKFTANL